MASKYIDTTAIMQVIGNVFNNPEFLDFTDKYSINDEDFPDQFHKIVFGTIYKLHELGEDFQLSNEELQKRERMYTETIQIQEKELEELERLIHMLEDRKKEEIIKGIKEKIDEKNRLESMLEIGDLSKKQY